MNDKKLQNRLNQLGVRYFSANELLHANRWGRIQELEHPSHGENLINLAVHLDAIREIWGGPIRVTSGYRSKEYNTLVGGAQRSQHLTGRAADLSPIGGDIERFRWVVETYATKCSASTGVGGYERFVHFDVYGRNRDARWGIQPSRG